MGIPPAVPQVDIPVGGVGGVGGLSTVPPTFLEKWGVVFVSVGGAWMLGVAIFILVYYFNHLIAFPVQSADAPSYKASLELHKTASDQFRDSVTYAFDLMVTKTVLPLVTLLLGYLFGSKKA